MSVIPDYFSPTTHAPEVKRTALHIARWCGAVPLILGVLTFLLWLLTRADELAMFGLAVIVVGLGMFAIGSVSLLTHVMINWHFLCRSDDRKREWGAIVVAAFLLLVNFPACWVIILVVSEIKPMTMD